MWCSEQTWKAILAQNKIIHTLVEGVNNNINWMSKIKTIQINSRPRNPLTRPSLCNYAFKPENKSFVLDIFYPPEPEPEEL